MPRRKVQKRLRAERESREQREWLQVILRSIGDGIVATDSEGKVKLLNPAAEALTGFRQDEAIGRPLEEVLRTRTRGDKDGIEPLWLSTEASSLSRAVTEQRVLVHTDGTERTVELQLNPIRFSGSVVAGVVLTFADITDRKALEEKLRQSHKLESVGRLAGGVAHDFNNMLTIINGCSDLALNSVPRDEPLASLLSEIRTAGARAAELTRQLLAFSRRQIISPQLLDLSEIVVDTERMLARLLGEDIRLATTLEPHLGPVLADRGQMQQVLINLAINARDAMPRGGDLAIMTRNADFDERYARAHVDVQPGQYVVLEVRDSGDGLTDEIKASIFEPFVTTKPTGRGTGLGLAVVHGIVTQAGGHIDVTSEKGKGTVFRMCLPRAMMARSPQSRQNGLSSDVLSGSETILVVEDEQAVRSFIGSALAKFGYNVMSAPEVEAAIEIARNHSSPIHLLITDVVMPGGGGSAVAREIVELHPETKILFISGYTDDAVLRSGVIYEEVNFLDKPFTASVLASKVRDTLDR